MVELSVNRTNRRRN